MEVERDFEFYLPKPCVPEKASSLLEAFSIKQGFKKEHTLPRMAYRIAAHFLRFVESIIGPLHSFEGIHEQIPPPLKAMLEYLFEKKAIKNPKFFLNPPFNDEPKFYAVSIAPNLEKEELASISGVFSQGYSSSFEEALYKAIGEFLERFVLFNQGNSQTFLASPDELIAKGQRFLHPDILAGFSEEQKSRYQKRVFDNASQFSWVRGRIFKSKQEALIPAQLIYWYCPHIIRSEPFLRERNTNGAAGMFTLNGAILAGLRELVQRDAFLIFWLNTIAPPRIDAATIKNEEINNILKKIRRYGLDVEILDITSDIGLPAFAAVLLYGTDETKSAFVGAGSEGNPENALKSALIESLSVYHGARKLDEFSLPPSYSPFTTPLSLEERIRLWANPRMFPRLKWFLEGRKIVFEPSRYALFSVNPETELALLCRALKNLGPGYEIYYYVSPHALMKELSYYVVRVIVPQLVPLYLQETNAPLGASRIQKAPNPLPHPFP